MESVNNEIKLRKEPFKGDGVHFGVVLYPEPSAHNGDKTYHILAPKEVILTFMRDFLSKTYGAEVSKYILGHEHGDENGICHMQCYFKLSSRLNRRITPFTLELKDEKLLGMFQSARKPLALQNYCKKGEDFIESPEGDDDTSVWTKLVAGEVTTCDDAVALMKTKAPKELLMFGDRIVKNFASFVETSDLPEFEWRFPAHITDFLAKDVSPCEYKTFFRYDIIRKWFTEHCVADLPRRKALFLFSCARGMGKTEFARRLVPNEAYYVYCRGTLDGREFEKKQKTAKLVILDDVSYIGKDEEMWKALISGESVNIRTPYCNTPWDGGRPCVVITNKYATLKFWYGSPLFNTQCVFVNVEEYMGPEGTMPDFLNKVEDAFDDDFRTKLENDIKAGRMKKQKTDD